MAVNDIRFCNGLRTRLRQHFLSAAVPLRGTKADRISRLLVLTLSLLATPGFAADWRHEQGLRWRDLTFPTSTPAGFTLLPAPQTGLSFTNYLPEEKSLANQILLNGSGVAAGDVDGDGLCDLYFCALEGGNVLFKNLGGFRFQEMAREAAVRCLGQASTGAAFADVDGDGDLDLLVNGLRAGTRLFLNDGRGHFEEWTDSAGLRNTLGSTSLALADADGDGWLDLYVVNYRSDTMRDMPDMDFKVFVTNGVYQLLTVNGQSASSPEHIGRFTLDKAGSVLENGQPDGFYRNLGKGRFRLENWTNGAFLDERGQTSSIPYDWGLSATFRDLNGDGFPDLYVCNDFQSPDRIWINDGKGHFQALKREAIMQSSLFSMGVDIADINRDGFPDIFVADMLSRSHALRQIQVMGADAFKQVRNQAADRPQISRNTLLVNRGNQTYAEIARLAGLEASEWSWCPAFLDVDLDGFEDLIITTGHWRDAQNADVAQELQDASDRKMPFPEQLRLRRKFPRLETGNLAFQNRRDLTFEPREAEWGLASKTVSQGLALADLDQDGDLDLIITTLNGPPLLYRNNSPAPRVAIRLAGLSPNTRGIGARLKITGPGLPIQTSEMICGGRYLSSDDNVRTFAAGNPTNRLDLEVRWPGGKASFHTNLLANREYIIEEPVEALNTAPAIPPKTKPLFEDLSSYLAHLHTDEPFDDFARQPSLPRRTSGMGPGLAWFDFNGDGWDDLMIAGGSGGRLSAFRNDGWGGFVRQKAALLEKPSDRAITALLGYHPSTTQLDFLMGLENPSAATNSPALRTISLLTGTSDESSLQWGESAGPLALGDLDGDGHLELFIGGRVRPGAYPEEVSSMILRDMAGSFRPDTQLSKALQDLGLMTAAVFSDLDGDGRAELIVASDWGPIRIFHQPGHELKEIPAMAHWGSAHMPMAELTGWWNSLATGDFDGDGRLDFIAGNWGRNSRPGSRNELLYYSQDVNGDPLIEAQWDESLRKNVPVRDLRTLSALFPMLRESYPTFRAFSEAGMEDIFKAGLPPMRRKEAHFFDSVVFLNRTNHFLALPLPPRAQFSPVFGIGVGDFNGDGKEDLVLAQNFFGVPPGDSRQDAGCGLLLLGKGTGEFEAIPPSESGVAFYGEGRAVAVSDFDHDGRLDFAATQYRGATRLYHNVSAKPGLRVHLQGPSGNLQAIGTVAMVHYRNGKHSPAKEIRAGSGCLAQDSADLLFAREAEPETLEIHWPGSRSQTITIPPNASFLEAKY